MKQMLLISYENHKYQKEKRNTILLHSLCTYLQTKKHPSMHYEKNSIEQLGILCFQIKVEHSIHIRLGE